MQMQKELFREKEMIRFFYYQSKNICHFKYKIIKKLKMTQPNEGIFINQAPHNEINHVSQLLVNNPLSENQYLEQFLESSHSINLQQRNFASRDQQKPAQNQIGTGRFTQHDQDLSENAQNSKRKKSFFHNFQKHLVITLRNIVKLKKCEKKGELFSIAKQMWAVFAKSSLYSKKYLHVLYGVDKDDEQFSKEFLIGLGYMEFFSKYSESIIKQVQQLLRTETIKQLSQISLKTYLSYRKMERAAQFQKYLQEFIQQLREGCIKKRLPKQRKQNFMRAAIQGQKNQRNTE